MSLSVCLVKRLDCGLRKCLCLRCLDPEGVCIDFLLLCSSSSLVLKWMKSQMSSLMAEEVAGNE